MRCWKHFVPEKPIDKIFVQDGCQDGPVRNHCTGSQKKRRDPEFCGQRAVESSFGNRKDIRA